MCAYFSKKKFLNSLLEANIEEFNHNVNLPCCFGIAICCCLLLKTEQENDIF